MVSPPPGGTAPATDPPSELPDDWIPDDAWIDVRIIGRWLTVSPSWVYRNARAGQFPEPVVRGNRMTRWRAGAVRAWMQLQEGGSQGSQPAAGGH